MYVYYSLIWTMHGTIYIHRTWWMTNANTHTAVIIIIVIISINYREHLARSTSREIYRKCILNIKHRSFFFWSVGHCTSKSTPIDKCMAVATSCADKINDNISPWPLFAILCCIRLLKTSCNETKLKKKKLAGRFTVSSVIIKCSVIAKKWNISSQQLQKIRCTKCSKMTAVGLATKDYGKYHQLAIIIVIINHA
jgi:hypothetical protein